MQTYILNNESLLIIFGALCLVEQIVYHFMMAYPYRYGIRVHTLNVSNYELLLKTQIKAQKLPLKIKAINDGSEIFLRFKFPPLTAGPLLFIANIQKKPEPVATIRIGYATSLFIAYLLFGALPEILKDVFYGLMNIIILAGVVLLLYLQFITTFKKWILLSND